MKWLQFAPHLALHATPRLTFDALWSLPAEEQITRWRTSDVSRIHLPTPDGPALPAYRKRYRYPGFSSKWKGLPRNTFFGSSRAMREYRNLGFLHRAGLSRVRALAVGEHRILRILSRALIITEAVKDTHPLDALLAGPIFRTLEPEHSRRLAAALGRWISALHGRGYRDRGLKARNILVHRDRHRWSFSKIDSPKGRGGRDLPSMHQPYLNDLRDLWTDLKTSVAKTWILRALYAYQGASNVDTEMRNLALKVLILEQKHNNP